MNNADIRYANAELSKRPKPQAKTADTLLYEPRSHFGNVANNDTMSEYKEFPATP